jgi:transcriptional regulator with XRE-family HTH domain
MAIPAHFERRSAARTEREPRRKLLLGAEGTSASGGTTDVQIHNISATGLLFECAAALEAGETIEIDLPQAGQTAAKIMWASGRLFGCQFEVPISSAVLAAARLRSAVEGEVALAHDSGAATSEAFGVRLLRLRKARGLTLEQVAAGLNVSKPTVWAWEKGRAHPVDERIGALAEMLGVDRDELLAGGNDSALQELFARSREAIARACGTSPNKVKIFIEL